MWKRPTLTVVLDGVAKTISLTVEELNDELEGSAELCERTSLVNTGTEKKVEKVLDERGRSKEEAPV